MRRHVWKAEEEGNTERDKEGDVLGGGYDEVW
jgi:hypothetical protein